MKTTSPKKKKRPQAGQPRGLSATAGYAVRFRVHIHGCFAGASSLDVWMEKTVTLPIPPAVGMEVSHGDWNAIITSIYLPLDRGTIEAFVEDDKEIYNAQLRHEAHRPIKEIVKEYQETGWKVTRDA